MKGALERASVALAATALLASGCGGGDTAVSFKKAGPPAPKKCVERWNRDDDALSAGRHAFSAGHDSRAGRVFHVNEPERDLVNACFVVFAANESDREYGTLGMFSSETRSISGLPQTGWRYITLLPVESEQERHGLQRSGAERANVALDKSGKVEPLE